MPPVFPLAYYAGSCGVGRRPASRGQRIAFRPAPHTARLRAESSAPPRTILLALDERRWVTHRTRNQSASDIAASLTNAHRKTNRLAHSSGGLLHVAA